MTGSVQQTLGTGAFRRSGCASRAAGGVDLWVLLAVLLACACTASRGRNDDAATCNGGAACGAAIDGACAAGGCAAGTGAGGSANAADAGPEAGRADASVDAVPDAVAPGHDAAASDATAVTDDGGTDGGAEASGAPICAQQSGDYATDGPYEVATMDVDLGAVAHLSNAPATVYHPAPLREDCLHAILAWGNGTGVFGTETYDFYHRRAASWGFVVVAPHQDLITDDGGVQRAGIEWLLAQNDAADSPFRGRLAATVGVAGHAQGAFAAAQASKQLRVGAAIAIDGPIALAPSVPVLCLTGANALRECVPAIGAATGPAFLASWEAGDHVTTPTVSGYEAMNPGTMQFLRLYTAWFRCFLANDTAACGLFEGGADCGLCRESGAAGWDELSSKNL